jgi:hypothetical protein
MRANLMQVKLLRSQRPDSWLVRLALALMLSIAISACSAPPPEAAAPAAPSPKPVAEQQAKQPEARSTDFPVALGEALRQDLSKQIGKAADQVQVSKTSRQTWPDGCLGLAKPEELCTQMRVDGWQVVLSDGSQQWTYRSDRTGRIYRRQG